MERLLGERAGRHPLTLLPAVEMELGLETVAGSQTHEAQLVEVARTQVARGQRCWSLDRGDAGRALCDGGAVLGRHPRFHLTVLGQGRSQRARTGFRSTVAWRKYIESEPVSNHCDP